MQTSITSPAVEPTSAFSQQKKEYTPEPYTDVQTAAQAAAQANEGLTIHQLIEIQAARTPDAVAVVHPSGKTLTYAALNQQANQLARYLVSLGVNTGQLIGLSMTRSLNMVVAFLGVLKAGAAYVPIDPNYPESRRQYILEDAGVEITLTESTLLNTLGEQGQQSRMICLDTQAHLWATQSKENLTQENLTEENLNRAANQSDETPTVVDVSPDDIAYVIYTSGTTGNPKGAMVRHEGLVNHATAMARAFEMRPADRMLQFSSISFDIIVEELYPTLISGATLVLRPDAIATSISEFIQFTTEQEITILDLPTAFWHELVGTLAQNASNPSSAADSPAQLTLSKCIRLVIVGGEKASRAIYAQWYGMFKAYPRWLNTYGPTETTVSATLYDPIQEKFDLSQELPIGRAIENVTTYVLSETLEPVKPSEIGELYIGGLGLARGYLNKPEKTAQVFVDSPFEKGKKLYKTGDLVKMDRSGLIEFVGRADFQVKIRGFRIELGEIESCLDLYNKIEQRIVVVREDTPGNKQLVAYIVMKAGKQLDRTHLKAFMQEKLPDYMIPSAVIALESLPKNTHGKIDRKALPSPNQANTQRTLVEAKTPLEEKLLSLWQSVLNVEEISVTDDFFELGGSSLLVIRLFSELEASFEQRLPLVEIFAAPTIESMARRIAEVTTKTANPAQTDNGALVLLKTGRQSVHKTAEPKNIEPKNIEPENIEPENIELKKAELKKTEPMPPLFLVHDVEGDTTLYLNLARQLESDAENARAVYAIRPQRISRDGNAPLAHTRIREFAAYCLESIRKQQPHGPYLIGGLCAGGVIAYETACQLEQAGETVKLILMETPAPDAEQKEGLVANQRIAGLGEVWRSQKPPLTIARQVLNKAANTVRYEAANAYERLSVNAMARTFQWIQDREKPIPQWLRALSNRDIILSDRDIILFAYDTYRPSSAFAGDVMLIRATQGDGSKADNAYVHEYVDETFGWRPYVQRPIAVCDVPGGHSSMLNATHAPTVAEALAPFVANISTSNT